MNRKQFRELYNFSNALSHCAKCELEDKFGCCLHCAYEFEPECQEKLKQNIDKYFKSTIAKEIIDILEGVEDI